MFKRFALIVAAMLIVGAHANAQGFGLSELRAGVMAHSIDERGPSNEILNLTRWEDVTFEALFYSPDIEAFRWIGSPKPNIGATLNTNGRESMVHLGLTWQVPVFDSPFFVEGTFGAALHNGALNGAVAPARNLGCGLQFYESAGVGMNVADNMTVMLAWEHASTANLCAPNRGLTNIGVKVGYKF